VTVLNVFVFFLIVGQPRSIVVFNRGICVLVGISAAYFLFLFLVLLLSRISFNKKDLHLGLTMFFKHGILATNIIVIPYNRVQHVALHEGFISGILDWQNRSFAGGSASDIEIPELKEQAENIKQLLMGKFKNNCK
jgi:membrane protein YdbS with pleckstrin-like domain